MNLVTFRVSKPEEMRYKTVGDWYTELDKETNTEKTIIECVDLGETAMNFLILIHEFVEYTLCNAEGITQEEVDEYDFEHQDEQDEEELGENEDAPYHEQHMIADGLERIFCTLLQVNWQDYTEAVEEKWKEVDRAINKRIEAEEAATVEATDE